jgi:hypothetical protein
MNPGNIPRINATFINGRLSRKRILDIQYDIANTNTVDIIQEKIAIIKVFMNIFGKFRIPVSVNNFV